SGWKLAGRPSKSTQGLVGNEVASIFRRSAYVAEILASFEGHSILPTGIPALTRSATQPFSVTAPSRSQSKAPLHIWPLFFTAFACSPVPICRRLFLHATS